jgi:hypothetical protein
MIKPAGGSVISHQHSLDELRPGSPGGRALAGLRGPGYFKELGSRGGRTTVQRYGLLHFRQLAAAGGREKKRRLYTWTKTIIPWHGVIERRIPYWPPRSTTRRRRPIFVYVEVQQ